jgi:hypothetical protein
MGGYTRIVSAQRLGKHVPAATDTNATVVQQERNGGKHVSTATNPGSRAVFSAWFVSRCYKERTRLELSSLRESVKRGLEPEAEE